MKRLLKLKEAAAYCGIPVRNFEKHMPVQPIRLGPHVLWDIRKIDALIDALQGDKAEAQTDWTEEVKQF